MTKYFIIFILTLFYSCSDRKTVIEKWKNGNTKTILDFESVKDSIFSEKKFNEKGGLTEAINHRNSILNGEWTSYKDNIKFSSGELIMGKSNLSKVTWYYENGNVKTERYYDNKGNLYQEIGYYNDHHVQEVLFYSNKVKRNQYKSWYGWFPNGNLQYIQDTVIFPHTFNQWDSIGNKIIK